MTFAVVQKGSDKKRRATEHGASAPVLSATPERRNRTERITASASGAKARAGSCRFRISMPHADRHVAPVDSSRGASRPRRAADSAERNDGGRVASVAAVSASVNALASFRFVQLDWLDSATFRAHRAPRISVGFAHGLLAIAALGPFRAGIDPARRPAFARRFPCPFAGVCAGCERARAMRRCAD
ncbi:hypothetical protein [Burkholderia thailandensis]|uniref:hypothetical protein n=1 Tax=Burkholderia thailandensis TaxID=57975 RepID=UPI003F9234DA